MKVKEILVDGAKAFIVGTTTTVPGVSTGTIALIVKLYDKFITSLANLTKNFWPSVKTLIPIGIGMLLATLGTWFPLKLATENILFAVLCLFAGSIIGSVPGLADNIKGEKIKKKYWIYLIIAIAMGAILGVLSHHCNFDVSHLFKPKIDWKLYFIIIPVGIVSSIGMVVPGISGSMLMLTIGFYTQILGLVDIMRTDHSQIIPALSVYLIMSISVLIGMVLFSILMKKLFKNAHTATFIWILGFIGGSIFSLFYNHDIMNYYTNHGVPWWEGVLGVVFFIGGFVGSYFLVRYQRKQTADNNKDEIGQVSEQRGNSEQKHN